jgi:predicted KAP-like P-loop ATPase
MRDFANRTIRDVLLGLLLGAATALGIRVAAGFIGTGQAYLKHHIAASLLVAVTRVSHFWLLTAVVGVCLLLLLTPKIAYLVPRLYRSWSASLITGIVPVWFLIALFFFLRADGCSGWCFLSFITLGFLPVVAVPIFRYQSTHAADAPLSIAEPTSVPDDSLTSRDITFDLPIRQWSEDRLNRVPFVRSVADLILKEKAPVIAIVGSFGEGKTSVLNLLDTTLAPRNDLVVVNFSSWLPGDEQILTSSLFATITERLHSRYIVPGLAKQFKQFARLLAGTVPKVGETLKQFFEEPSQMNQLSELRNLLSELPARVVVLVDELDRMDSAELHLLLKAIRGVVDLPNITYVCAFDKNAAVRLINENDALYGQFYLEKFFPIQLALPRTDQELLSKLFDRKLETICETFQLLQTEEDRKSFNEAVLPLWHTSIKRYLSNFRRMTLFFNAFRMSLEPVVAEVNLFDMMVLQLVKMISEDTYQFIYDNGPLFYYPRWRITLWMERLSIDDKQEAAVRDTRLKAFFDSLPAAIRGQLTPLLSVIFPTVDQAVRGDRFSLRSQSEQDADNTKRIFHPDYFPRYFIHQVPAGMFGRVEMTNFLVQLNAQQDVERSVAKFRETFDKLASNPWKRYGFLDAFVADTARVGEVQSEGLILGIAEVSDLLESDFLGISDWGRARALLFAAAQRFEGTAKLQEVLIAAIRRCSSDGFATDILRYSTTMRSKNSIITNWQNVDESAIKRAFCERMRSRYAVGSEIQFPYRKDDLSPFFAWAAASSEDKTREIAFFRDRFRRYPIELGKFLGWALQKDTVAYQGDPLLTPENLFPIDELFELVTERNEEEWSESDRASVLWFLELVAERRRGGIVHNPAIEESPPE